MLYVPTRDLREFLDPDRVFYGEGRGETGICLHLGMKDYVAGSAPGEDYTVMMSVANHLIDFLLYRRLNRGPEAWDYDAEKASEVYAVCGDNLSTSGIIILDKHYSGGAKLQIFLDKTFGANEIAVLWKSQLVGDEALLHDYADYLLHFLRNGSSA